MISTLRATIIYASLLFSDERIVFKRQFETLGAFPTSTAADLCCGSASMVKRPEELGHESEG